MAVKKVRPGEIVEVPFLLPDGVFKVHPALVVSPMSSVRITYS